MDSTNSILRTVLIRVRALADSPDLSAKYNDDWLVRHVVLPAMGTISARAQLNAGNPVLLRHVFTPTQNVEFYALPPHAAQIWRVCRYNADRVLQDDWRPRDFYHPLEQGWAIEGQTLVLRPPPPQTSTDSWEVWYLPSGHIQCHLGDGTLAGDLKTLTLAASPTLGPKDRRPQAYSGCLLRLIPASGIVEERLVRSHDPAAGSGSGTVSVEPAFSSTGAGSVLYEIVPLWGPGYAEAVAAQSAYDLGVIGKVGREHLAALQNQLTSARKTLMDTLGDIQARTGKHWKLVTVDAPMDFEGW